jgi:hypothetical protein
MNVCLTCGANYENQFHICQTAKGWNGAADNGMGSTWVPNGGTFWPPPLDPRAGLQGMNDLIALEPFPKTDAPKAVIKSGFARDVRRGTLIPLRVVIGTYDYPAGSIAYVKSDNAGIQPWSKEIFELVEGQPFMLVPKQFILLRFVDTSPSQYGVSGTVTGTAGYSPSGG